MQKVVYFSNKEVPYRVEFFNMLGRETDLTVVYDTRNPGSRDSKWAASVKAESGVERIFLPEGRRAKMKTLLNIIRRADKGTIFVAGCVNTFSGLAVMTLCRMLRKRLFINFDGEQFINSGLKSFLKRIVLSGAECYLTAGHHAAESIRKIAGKRTVIPYAFSSLTERDIIESRRRREAAGQPDVKAPVLVVGQYFAYKGLDIALNAARADRSIPYIFVGAGKAAERFINDFDISPASDPNITVIPFLQKKALTEAYLSCSVMVLPSRQECWGLVVNEAAALGTPVVSTRGCGSAVEMVSDLRPEMVVEQENSEALLSAIRRVRAMTPEETESYSDLLMDCASRYTIEQSVADHLRAFS